MNDCTFRLAEWIQRFPLKEYDPEAYRMDLGPAEAAYAEQLRRLVTPPEDLGNAVPTDVFIMGLGEPMRREMTKIGGIPCRPANAPWPQSAGRGGALQFVAQFNFTESRDLFDSLPGDLLLAFFEDFAAYPHDEMFPEPPHFEWWSIDELNARQSLVHQADMPEVRFVVPVLHGYRHRTVDYLDETRATDALEGVVIEAFKLDSEYTVDHKQLRDEICARFVRFDQFKIGGLPFCGLPAVTPPEHLKRMTFLATLPSVFGGCEGAYPFVNIPEGPTDCPLLSWSEGGRIHLLLDDDGSVHPWFVA